MHNEIAAQEVMVLLEAYLINALLRHNITVSIRTIQHWGIASESKVASR